jgi:uncharacterized membrane protein HdeD (DUF308 family)
MQFNLVSIILFGILGAALAWADVSVVNKPLEFCVILATVVAIDFASAYYATR